MTIPDNDEILAMLDRLDTIPADALESDLLDFKLWENSKNSLKVAVEYAVCFANS